MARTWRNAGTQENDLTLDYTPECTVGEREARRCTLAALQRGLALRPMRFGSTSAVRYCRDRQELREAFANSDKDVETLAFVRRVQGLGFKLSEIRSLLNLRGSSLHPCAPVRRRLQAKLADVRRKRVDLQKLEHELRVALRSCERELRKRSPHCPILRDGTQRKPWGAQ